MFIRRTLTRRTGGQDYHSYRLVPSERDGDKVRQRTLLNLGSDFDLPKEAWPELCRRIDESLNGQAPLLDDTPAVVEEEAQRIVAQLLARGRGTPRRCALRCLWMWRRSRVRARAVWASSRWGYGRPSGWA